VEKQLSENKIDVVFSHTCPAKYIPTECFLSGIDQSRVDNSTEEWLDTIEDKLE
jgi:3-oxoacid CoA-transferase subunit A